jgi:hypothetical protein
VLRGPDGIRALGGRRLEQARIEGVQRSLHARGPCFVSGVGEARLEHLGGGHGGDVEAVRRRRRVGPELERGEQRRQGRVELAALQRHARDARAPEAMKCRQVSRPPGKSSAFCA